MIGMTNVTEAKLAREAGLCYATLALVTDYDCWKVEEEEVTLEAVLEIMHKNVEMAQRVLKDLIGRLETAPSWTCKKAAANAIVTDRSLIPEKLKKDMSVLFESYRETKPVRKINRRSTTLHARRGEQSGARFQSRRRSSPVHSKSPGSAHHRRGWE